MLLARKSGFQNLLLSLFILFYFFQAEVKKIKVWCCGLFIYLVTYIMSSGFASTFHELFKQLYMLYVLCVWSKAGCAYLEMQDNCLLKQLMKYKVQLLNS